MNHPSSTKRSDAYDSLYHVPVPDKNSIEKFPSYTLGADFTVPELAITQLEKDGVVCLRNVLDLKTVNALRDEADSAVANPSEHARFVSAEKSGKIFYYEFNLWRRHPIVRSVTFDSHIVDVAAKLMRSELVTLYYTNTFVKDPGTDTKVTPWHEDASYSRFVGKNVINMNISFDYMPSETTLKFKQGSHKRNDPLSIGPTFIPGVEYSDAMPNQVSMPSQSELDERFGTLYWEVNPGDALVFYQRTIHAGPGNTLPTRRHSTAFNFAGDGVTYDAREGFIDSPDIDPDLQHGDPPAGRVFPKLK
jgi:ectoine hydroxylase-related dioxygenase (phytanoyl-CoA dioxygenase family)